MISVHLFLDVRKPLNDGTCPIKLSVHYNKTTVLIPTDFFVKPADWSKTTRQVLHLPNRVVMNSRLQTKVVLVSNELMDMLDKGKLRTVTPTSLRAIVTSILYPGTERKDSFGSVYKEFVDKHENKRTREIYQATMNALRKFDKNVESKSFEDVDRRFLEKFFAWCAEKSPSVNARNIHMRNVRAVFNYAIDEEITTVYPFRKLKIRPEETRKRCLSAKEVHDIITANVPQFAEKYRDAFALSFFLIGANTIDICNLKAKDVNGGRLTYRRAKTHRLYDLKIEPEAQRILDKYHGRKSLLGWSDSVADYKTWSMKLNKYLKDIKPGLTTYFARHSWATIAASLDIPKETIAAALGHGGRTVTDIYISFDRKKVDEANRRVIDEVMKQNEV